MNQRFVSRAYNSFLLDPKKSIITKSSKEKKLRDEIDFYHGIPDHLGIYFPRMTHSGFDNVTGTYSMGLEYYPYDNLGKYLIGSSADQEKWWLSVADSIGSALKDFEQTKSWQPGGTLQAPLAKEDFRAMYFQKTEGEYLKLVDKFDVFTELAGFGEIIVNDVKYHNFEMIWNEIKTRFESLLIPSEDFTPSIIHGDCCFSNVLVGGVSQGLDPVVRFIDPRGTFGSRKIFGDPYYDLAKLMHSTEGGYEFFIYDRFNIVELGPNKFFLEYIGGNKDLAHKVFSEHIYSKFDMRKIKLIQGLIYVGMCARHYDSQKRQLAMYLTGVRLLNEVLQEA